MDQERQGRRTRNQVRSMGSWLGTLLLLLIPVIGWILCLVWAFGHGAADRRNFCRAYLLYMLAAAALLAAAVYYGIPLLTGIPLF